MSLDALLDHKCDIYHIREEGKSPGYNLPASPHFSYLEEPDISGQECHFGVRTQSIQIMQTAPINDLSDTRKLTLPAGVDIRINDKIVNCENGLEYTAEEPRNIRGHHTNVIIRAKGAQKQL